MTALIIVGSYLAALDMDNASHLHLGIVTTDQCRMRCGFSITSIPVPSSKNDVSIQINDIRHINICILVTDIISVDHVVDILSGRILLIMSVVKSAISHIALMLFST